MDFNACELDYLERTFGLIPRSDDVLLDDWLGQAQELTDFERQDAEALRKLLKDNSLHWNEQELSLHFIGPIFSLVNFTVVLKMNLFAQRFIYASIPDVQNVPIELSGHPDGMLASGYRRPETPYFSFQEYKKEKDPHGDPAGQCLAAMLAGQTLNGNPQEAVYGCYVVGENWRFIVLINKEYAISSAYSAQTDEVFFIIGVLKQLKQIVVARLG
jgi:hypothetical protein